MLKGCVFGVVESTQRVFVSAAKNVNGAKFARTTCGRWTTVIFLCFMMAVLIVSLVYNFSTKVVVIIPLHDYQDIARCSDSRFFASVYSGSYKPPSPPSDIMTTKFIRPRACNSAYATFFVSWTLTLFEPTQMHNLTALIRSPVSTFYQDWVEKVNTYLSGGDNPTDGNGGTVLYSLKGPKFSLAVYWQTASRFCGKDWSSYSSDEPACGPVVGLCDRQPPPTSGFLLYEHPATHEVEASYCVFTGWHYFSDEGSGAGGFMQNNYPCFKIGTHAWNTSDFDELRAEIAPQVAQSLEKQIFPSECLGRESLPWLQALSLSFGITSATFTACVILFSLCTFLFTSPNPDDKQPEARAHDDYVLFP